MLENLPEMNLNDRDADSASSGSDVEILPLDFRTAMVNGQLVIQAKPKDYKSANQTQKQDGKEDGEEDLDPDKAIGDINQYLKSVRKDAFDSHDPNVVLIAPNRRNKKDYKDILLPCEREKLLTNGHADGNGHFIPDGHQGDLEDDEQDALAGSLKQAQKKTALHNPDYYEKMISADRISKMTDA